jgi:hypothetical protein
MKTLSNASQNVLMVVITGWSSELKRQTKFMAGLLLR